MGADWLQGPYVYALYASYGFSKAEIGQLFIAGFSSSLIFGTIAGGVADKVGRKTMCIAFGIIYIGSCITKLFPDYWILMVGRLLGGIATSLLFSSFESWMVDEHKKRGFASSLLAGTFHLATLGNGVVAIASGLVASFVATKYGYVAPFLVAIVCLVISSIIILTSWSENYGDSKIEIIQTFVNAAKALASDKKILILGVMQSLFEASMYTFVFMWSPSLDDATGPEKKVPYGLVFACFMVAIMIGSSIFSIAINRGLRPETLISFVYLIATCAFIVVLFFKDLNMLVVAFLTFEVCCGIFFPCIGTLRGKYIDEKNKGFCYVFFQNST